MGRRVNKRRGGRQAFLNQSNKKLSNPMGKFQLSKYYYVQMPTAGAAPQIPAILQINAATPFQPLSVVSGTWTSNDVNNEPAYLDQSPWTAYNHLIVTGCHVKAVIKDSIDHPAGGQELLHEGIARFTRTSAAGTVNTGSTNSNLRALAYSKGKAFQLAKSNVSTPMAKNCLITQGYSAKRTWGANPMGQDQLRVSNLSGSNNAPSDNTYINLSIHVADEHKANETLKQFKVQLLITYFIRFQEPTVHQNVPRPIEPKQKHSNKKYKRYSILPNSPYNFQKDFYTALGIAAMAYRARR